MGFIKTLMNVDQIYSYLLKLKFNLRTGPNSIYIKNTLSMVTKINAFTLSKKIKFQLLEKTAPLPPENIWYKNSNLESIPPYLL